MEFSRSRTAQSKPAFSALVTLHWLTHSDPFLSKSDRQMHKMLKLRLRGAALRAMAVGLEGAVPLKPFDIGKNRIAGWSVRGEARLRPTTASVGPC
jgi:hypothetical protein